MAEIEKQIMEVLYNINWFLKAHNSLAELIEVEGIEGEGIKVTVRYTGPCAGCKTDCLGVTFKEQLPEINLIYYNRISS